MEKTDNNKGLVVFSVVLIFVAISCMVIWQGRMAKLKEAEQGEAYLMAAEGFRVMHHDAELPIMPKNMAWTGLGGDDFLMEADGFQLSMKGKVPKRWSVKLHHGKPNWEVSDPKWKD